MEIIKAGEGISPYANACDPNCDGHCTCKSNCMVYNSGSGCSIQVCIMPGSKRG